MNIENRTNREVMQSLSDKHFAELFVHSAEYQNYDYDYEGNLIECGTYDIFVSPLLTQKFTDYYEAVGAVQEYLAQDADPDWEYALKADERDVL